METWNDDFVTTVRMSFFFVSFCLGQNCSILMLMSKEQQNQVNAYY